MSGIRKKSNFGSFEGGKLAMWIRSLTIAVAIMTTIILPRYELRADALTAPSFNDDEWRIDITPYLFLPASVSGDSTVAGQTVSLDLDTSDLLEVLSFAVSGRVEAWKSNFGIIFDTNYINLDAGGTVSGPGPFMIGANVDVDVRQFYLDSLLSYRLIHEAYNTDGDLWAFEVMGGVRYNYLKQEIDLDVSGGPGAGIAQSLGGSETWLDPLIGVRATVSIDDQWTAGFRADAGGFGISDTDLTWSLTGGFDYRGWDALSLKFGWRAYSIDYETEKGDGTFAYDIFEHGPFVALTYRLQ